MPGPHLFPGLQSPTPLDDVSINIVYGPLETSRACNRKLIDEGKWGIVALNCLLNGCFVAGCASVTWFPDGKVYRCDVYAAWDADFIVEHELKHCEGYADALY